MQKTQGSLQKHVDQVGFYGGRGGPVCAMINVPEGGLFFTECSLGLPE